MSIKKDITDISLNDFNFLESIIDELPHIVFVKDGKNLRYVRINKSFENAIGIKRRNIIGKTDFDIFPESLAKTFTEIDRIVLKTGKLYEIPVEEVPTKHMGLRLMQTKKMPVKAPGSENQYLLGISEDLTEKIAFENQLKNSQANLTSLIESTNDSIWSIDTDYRILTINNIFRESFKIAFGITLEPGTRIIDHLPEPFKTTWTKRYQRALMGEHFKVLDQFDIKKLPEYVEVSFNPIYIENKIIGVSCFLKDISSYKRTELELIEKEQKFRLLSYSTSQLLNQPDSISISKYLADHLQKIIGNVYVFVVKIDETNKIVELAHMAGLDSSLSNKIISLLDYNPYNKTYRLVEIHKRIFQSNKLIETKRKLKDFSENQIPEKVLNIIEKLLRVNKIYTIGISINNQLLAALLFFTKDRSDIKDKGFIEAFVQQASNIIQRKKLEEELISSEKKFRFLTENSKVIIWSTDIEFNYTYLSPEVENILGYTVSERIHTRINKYFPEDSSAKIIEIFNEMLKLNSENPNAETKQSFEIQEYHKNGELVDLEIKADLIINPDGEPSGFIGNSNDITERKNNEREIIRLHTVIEQSPTTIVITDLDGKIEYVNPWFTYLTGYTFEEVINANPRLLKSGLTPNETYQDLWNTIKNGRVWKGEFINKKKNGDIYWEYAHISPIFDKAGNIINYVAIKEDITTRKKAEEALKFSESELKKLNAQKDRFFSIIAHDLRNSIGNFIQITELLNEDEDLRFGEYERQYLDMLQASAEKTYKLLENLLLWARSQLGNLTIEPEVINVDTIIKESVDYFSETVKQKDIKVRFQYSDNLKAYADKQSVSTIIRNLFSNALKFSYRGGIIEISIDKSTKTGKNYIEIFIQDYGVGIEKEQADDLFKIFKQSTTLGTKDESGTGLGLILCKELAEKNNGHLYIESKIGEGTIARISLPEYRM